MAFVSIHQFQTNTNFTSLEAEMGGISKTYILIQYEEAVRNCEELAVLLAQSTCSRPEEKVNQIDVCYSKIEELIRIEIDFLDDVIYQGLQGLLLRLLDLRQRFINLIHPTDGETASPVLVNNPKHVNSDANELQKRAEATLVVSQLKGFEDISGLDNLKRELASMVLLPLHQPHLFVDRKLCNCILLYGPPGTGKTRMVHALAAKASARLYVVSASDVLNEYMGKSEKNLQALFVNAKKNRDTSTILFMDEIDGICRRRSENEYESSRRLKTEMMCQMSGIEDVPRLFFIAATNCPWDLDPAILRRFQRRFYLPLPTRPERFELLRFLTKNTPLQLTSNQWGPLLSRTEGYSASDMTDLVRNACQIPLSELVENRTWLLTHDGKYHPVSPKPETGKIILSDLFSLPPGSVQARPVQINDLMMVANVVKRTVSDEDVAKYSAFVNIH